jgi:hypothetical protein
VEERPNDIGLAPRPSGRKVTRINIPTQQKCALSGLQIRAEVQFVWSSKRALANLLDNRSRAHQRPEVRSFCVVSTSDSGRDQRLLEKDAQLLVRGTDAYGRRLTTAQQTALGVPDRSIVPLIVTNARLFNANYDPRDVLLDTGQLLIKPILDISPIECVRFRKALTAANRQRRRRIKQWDNPWINLDFA